MTSCTRALNRRTSEGSILFRSFTITEQRVKNRPENMQLWKKDWNPTTNEKNYPKLQLEKFPWIFHVCVGTCQLLRLYFRCHNWEFRSLKEVLVDLHGLPEKKICAKKLAWIWSGLPSCKEKCEATRAFSIFSSGSKSSLKLWRASIVPNLKIRKIFHSKKQ